MDKEIDEIISGLIVAHKAAVKTVCQNDDSPVGLTDAEIAATANELVAHLKAEAAQKIRAMVLAARIDELEILNTHRHYGKDYQDSLDELDEYKDKRLSELQAQLKGADHGKTED